MYCICAIACTKAMVVKGSVQAEQQTRKKTMILTGMIITPEVTHSFM